jgi:hypothetical protein
MLERDHAHVARCLLEEGWPSISEVTDTDGRTALLVAVAYGNLNTAMYLLPERRG